MRYGAVKGLISNSWAEFFWRPEQQCTQPCPEKYLLVLYSGWSWTDLGLFLFNFFPYVPTLLRLDLPFLVVAWMGILCQMGKSSPALCHETRAGKTGLCSTHLHRADQAHEVQLSFITWASCIFKTELSGDWEAHVWMVRCLSRRKRVGTELNPECQHLSLGRWKSRCVLCTVISVGTKECDPSLPMPNPSQRLSSQLFETSPEKFSLLSTPPDINEPMFGLQESFYA